MDCDNIKIFMDLIDILYFHRQGRYITKYVKHDIVKYIKKKKFNLIINKNAPNII
jgi:hypothetical protein